MLKVVNLVYPVHRITPDEFASFIELEGFLKDWNQLGLGDDELLQCQTVLMAMRDEASVQIDETNGLRELRFYPDDPPGRMVTVRYVDFQDLATIILVQVFTGIEELTSEERCALRDVIGTTRKILEQGSVRVESSNTTGERDGQV